MPLRLGTVDLGGDPADPLLVLGPSLGTALRTLWTAAARVLAGEFHVVGWELPGHGTGRPRTSTSPPWPARCWTPSPPRSRPLRRRLRRRGRRAPARARRAACDALAAFDLRDRLGDVDPPLTALPGEADAVIEVAAMRELAAGVRHGTLWTLPGVGHLAPAESPSAVARVVGDTVRRGAALEQAGRMRRTGR